MLKSQRSNHAVVSALRLRNGLGKLLRQVEKENRSLVIEKRGIPRAVLLSLKEYVRLAAPEPEILRVIGDESKAKGTNRLTLREINKEIKAVRAENARKSKRR